MGKKIRATRNKTVEIVAQEYEAFYSRLYIPNLTTNLTLSDVVNKTILSDLNTIIDYLPHAFADLLILDPPYNLTKDYRNYKFSARSSEDYMAYLRSWFPKVLRCLKPNGSLYICGDWKCTSQLQQILEEESLFILNSITWQREKGRGAISNWKNGMEDIWFAVRDSKDYYFDVDAVKLKRRVIAPYRIEGQPKDWEETSDGKFRMTYPSNFWDDITIPYWSMPENTDHPTQKPEKLIAKLILASTAKGGIVFDPFLGSGTTSVVAKKLARRYVGIEICEEYAMLSEKRLLMAESDSTIQGYTDGVFWERNTQSNQKRSKDRVVAKEGNSPVQTLF